MAKPDLIIFDCDGVLVDSELLANQVMADYLSEQGLPCTRQQATARFVGLSLVSIRNRVRDENGVTLPENFEKEIIRRDRLVFETNLKALPGISAVLETLATPKCVASSGAHQKIRTSLTQTGLLEYFEGHIFSAADVENGKPAPDLFLHAARNMNTRPENCLVIEDSLAGVQAGVAAGMQVFGFLGGGHIADGHGDRLLNAGADQIFKQMDDLGKLIPLQGAGLVLSL